MIIIIIIIIIYEVFDFANGFIPGGITFGKNTIIIINAIYKSNLLNAALVTSIKNINFNHQALKDLPIILRISLEFINTGKSINLNIDVKI